jgi:hypothetical protein
MRWQPSASAECWLSFGTLTPNPRHCYSATGECSCVRSKLFKLSGLDLKLKRCYHLECVHATERAREGFVLARSLNVNQGARLTFCHFCLVLPSALAFEYSCNFFERTGTVLSVNCCSAAASPVFPLFVFGASSSWTAHLSSRIRHQEERGTCLSRKLHACAGNLQHRPNFGVHLEFWLPSPVTAIRPLVSALSAGRNLLS